MRPPVYSDCHLYSVYFAPRGKMRMLNLGMQLAARHLSPLDRLIGVIGDAGSGKSILVKGMFPGLELSNDDQGVNVRPLPILDYAPDGFYSSHTYHLDIRFELAFTPLEELAEAVRRAVLDGKRVVVEHFDLLYPVLGMNAELLIGVGEEVLLTRPNIFGPLPADVARVVIPSQRYRKMAHTAENLTERRLAAQGITRYSHGDVRHGFVLEFEEPPAISLPALAKEVEAEIQEDIPVSYLDEGHILFGETPHPCTGPRIHVRSTGEIEHFTLLPEFLYDSIRERYMLVGLVGEAGEMGEGFGENLRDLNKLSL